MQFAHVPDSKDMTMAVWRTEEAWLGYAAKLIIHLPCEEVRHTIYEISGSGNALIVEGEREICYAARSMWWMHTCEEDTIELATANLPASNLYRHVFDLMQTYAQHCRQYTSLPELNTDIKGVEFQRWLRGTVKRLSKSSHFVPDGLPDEDYYHWLLWKAHAL